MKRIIGSMLFFSLFSLTVQSKDISKLIGKQSLITYESMTESKSSNGGSSKSSSRSGLIERVLEESDDILMAEYSFPESYQVKLDVWKLPARVLFKSSVPEKIINRTEIEKRLKNYLDQNPELADLCGQTIVTWAAISIDCSVDGILEIIGQFNLNIGGLLAENSYTEVGALSPVSLTHTRSSSDRVIYNGKLILDPQYLQSNYEASIESVANIYGKDFKTLFQSSLHLADGEVPFFSGTREVTIETSSTRDVLSVRRETIIEIEGGSSFRETKTIIEKIQREAVR